MNTTSDSPPAGAPPEASFVDPLEEVAPPLNQVAAAPSPISHLASVAKPSVPAFDLHQEAFDFDPHWQGRPLEAFTFTRQSLAAMLNSNSPGVGSGEAVNEAYMPAVWAVLYLCTHPPEAFRHLRSDPGRFWEVIETWAEDGEGDQPPGCPRDQWGEAIVLVYGSRPTEQDKTIPRRLGLWEAARANVVSVRRRPGQGRPGNVVCQ